LILSHQPIMDCLSRLKHFQIVTAFKELSEAVSEGRITDIKVSFWFQLLDELHLRDETPDYRDVLMLIPDNIDVELIMDDLPIMDCLFRLKYFQVAHAFKELSETVSKGRVRHVRNFFLANLRNRIKHTFSDVCSIKASIAPSDIFSSVPSTTVSCVEPSVYI